MYYKILRVEHECIINWKDEEDERQWGRLDLGFKVGANFVRVHSGSKNLS